MSRARQEVSFQETGDAREPYEALVDGERWTVRINEFPEEPSLYSLLVDGAVVEELMEWPAAWSRPAPPTHTAAGDPHEQAEYDREQAHFERTRRIPPSKRVK
jgi:hypothetical protein